MLEDMMGDVIADYVSPGGDRHAFTKDYILHNTFLDFHKKARLLVAISDVVGGPKFDKEGFHKISQTRNALAHGLTAHGKSKRINAKTGKEEEFLVIRIMNSNKCKVEE